MRRFRRLGAEIDSAIARVLAGETAILGAEVAAFEAEFAAFCGARHAVGVASGTDALRIALQGCGIGDGDEVLVPALTAHATAQAVLLTGAQPVYVDVDPIRRAMRPEAAEAAIGPRTAAIVPVHLYGVPADIEALADLARRKGLILIEDCAQAHGCTVNGRPVGTFGAAAAFSFYPTKNLGCIGDGGAIVTNDDALDARFRSLRNYGWRTPARLSEDVAGPSRLDELQAAILRTLLPHLGASNAERRDIAAQYRMALDGVVVLPEDIPGSVWHQYVIEVDDRAAVRAALDRAGIGTAIHYEPPLHLHPALRPARATPLPETERLCRRIVSLPIQPEVVGGRVEDVARALRMALAR
jgi:dTDP-4-amino-4,6-dideoxygalactose transaminase